MTGTTNYPTAAFVSEASALAFDRDYAEMKRVKGIRDKYPNATVFCTRCDRGYHDLAGLRRHAERVGGQCLGDFHVRGPSADEYLADATARSCDRCGHLSASQAEAQSHMCGYSPAPIDPDPNVRQRVRHRSARNALGVR